MAEFIFFYSNPAGKRSIIQQEQSIGHIVEHVDFVDEQGNPTNGNSGRITTTDVIPPSPPIVSITRPALRAIMEDQFAAVNNFEIIGGP